MLFSFRAMKMWCRLSSRSSCHLPKRWLSRGGRRLCPHRRLFFTLRAWAAPRSTPFRSICRRHGPNGQAHRTGFLRTLKRLKNAAHTSVRPSGPSTLSTSMLEISTSPAGTLVACECMSSLTQLRGGVPSSEHQDSIQVMVRTDGDGDGAVDKTHGVFTDVQFASKFLDLNRSCFLQVYCISLCEDLWQKQDTSSKLVPLVPLPGVDEMKIWRGWEFEKQEMQRLSKEKRKRTGSDMPTALQLPRAKKARGGGPAQPGLRAGDAEPQQPSEGVEDQQHADMNEQVHGYAEAEAEVDADESQGHDEDEDEQQGDWFQDAASHQSCSSRDPEDFDEDDQRESEDDGGGVGAIPLSDASPEAADVRLAGLGDELWDEMQRDFADADALGAHGAAPRTAPALARGSADVFELPGQGRPLGFLTTWLQAQFDFADQGARLGVTVLKEQETQMLARLYIVLFRKDKFSRETVATFKRSVEAVMEFVEANYPPKPLMELMLAPESPLLQELLAAKNAKKSQAPVCRDAASVWGQKWRQQAAEVRQSLGLHPASRPWTGMPGLKASEIPAIERERELLDIAVAAHLGGGEAVQEVQANMRHMTDEEQAAHMKLLCRTLFTDVSQNPARRAQSNQQGRGRCLTTSSRWYSHGQARMVTAFEFFRFQGHDLRVKIPDSVSQNQAAELDAAAAAVTPKEELEEAGDNGESSLCWQLVPAVDGSTPTEPKSKKRKQDGVRFVQLTAYMLPRSTVVLMPTCFRCCDCCLSIRPEYPLETHQTAYTLRAGYAPDPKFADEFDMSLKVLIAKEENGELRAFFNPLAHVFTASCFGYRISQSFLALTASEYGALLKRQPEQIGKDPVSVPFKSPGETSKYILMDMADLRHEQIAGLRQIEVYSDHSTELQQSSLTPSGQLHREQGGHVFNRMVAASWEKRPPEIRPTATKPETLAQLQRLHNEADQKEKELANQKKQIAPVKVEDDDDQQPGSGPVRQLGIDLGNVSDLNEKAPKKRVTGKAGSSDPKPQPIQSAPAPAVKSDSHRPTLSAACPEQTGVKQEVDAGSSVGKTTAKSRQIAKLDDDMQVVAKKHLAVTPTGQINSLEGLVPGAFLLWDADRKPLMNVLNGVGWGAGTLMP
ncbi:unnamed protein product [Symbiodinium sp. CCMP2592]|nr:unnamed protein product [Symbiodinium sp. CCMP2592]